jgi:hypothetical protein
MGKRPCKGHVNQALHQLQRQNQWLRETIGDKLYKIKILVICPLLTTARISGIRAVVKETFQVILPALFLSAFGLRGW